MEKLPKVPKKTAKCQRCGRRQSVGRIVEIPTEAGTRRLCFPCRQARFLYYASR